MIPDTNDNKSEMGLKLVTESAEHTQILGRILGELAEPGDLYLLVGDLGTGKTCLTQGILWGLGSEDIARSPTFVLISEYEARLTLYHMDIYRLDNIDDISDLGIDEYIYGEGLTVVEWPDNAIGAFPDEYLMITIKRTEDTERQITLTPKSKRYNKLIKDVEHQAANKNFCPRLIHNT